MKEYRREYPRFSLCGLNCGLCPAYHAEGPSRCPGCGGEGFSEAHPSCAVVRCARDHGEVEFCCQCAEYPCARYACVSPIDSFITYRNVLSDFQKLRDQSLEAYKAELDEKVGHLRFLLERFNDGRKKSLYCTAVNLLPIEDVREVVRLVRSEIPPDADVKQAAARVVEILDGRARVRGISLKLIKKK